MDFELSPTAQDLQERLLDFVHHRSRPAEQIYRDQMATSGDPHFHPPVIEELKAEARRAGLWNLFLPHATAVDRRPLQPRLRAAGRDHGPRPARPPRPRNCSAPDTGNMEILAMFGTPEQKERWLQPLLGRRDPLVLRDDRAGGGARATPPTSPARSSATATST